MRELAASGPLPKVPLGRPLEHPLRRPVMRVDLRHLSPTIEAVRGKGHQQQEARQLANQGRQVTEARQTTNRLAAQPPVSGALSPRAQPFRPTVAMVATRGPAVSPNVRIVAPLRRLRFAMRGRQARRLATGPEGPLHNFVEVPGDAVGLMNKRIATSVQFQVLEMPWKSCEGTQLPSLLRRRLIPHQGRETIHSGRLLSAPRLS
mmetsp:Transcript_84443/g.176741  ORF Transcript_84443/g.176741 Transcript_84443/m.176741 type:complete len:205 (-) Transcript_84443:856-1470(-)